MDQKLLDAYMLTSRHNDIVDIDDLLFILEKLEDTFATRLAITSLKAMREEIVVVVAEADAYIEECQSRADTPPSEIEEFVLADETSGC